MVKKGFLITCVAFLYLLAPGHPQLRATGQMAGGVITILNQGGQVITSLTDGDRIRVKLELPNTDAQERLVGFYLQGLDIEISHCRLRAGQSRCESEPFTSQGWFWNPEGKSQAERIVEARAEGRSIATSGTLQVAPRPVVMVHGFSSNWEAWMNYLGPQGYLASVGLHGFAVGDGQVKGVMNTGNLANPTGRTNTIAENAAILGQYIREVKHRTGSQKIDLLVHSLGGLISRYYIDRLMPEGEVVNLLILGSPMNGTGCANLPAALGFYLPAVLEFQPSYVQDIFNPQITHRRGVIFSALAGVPLVDPIQSPCTPVPSDMAVSLGSVKGIPMEVSELPILHTALNTSADVFSQFVLPHLQTAPGEFASASDLPTPIAKADLMQFTRVHTGHINPGEAEEVTINIDPNVSVASFALFDSSHSLAIEVTGASGKVLNLDPVTNGVIQVDDPTSLVYLGYGFNNPKPGAWKVRLIPTDKTPVAGADYALTAVFHGGAILSSQASVLSPALREPVQLNASLELNGSPLDIRQATVFIRAGDNSLQKIEMEKAPDSSKVQATWKPTQAGLSGIEFRVSAESPDGHTIERTGFLTIEVQPRSGKTVMGVFIVVGVLTILGVSIVWLVKKFREKRNLPE